MVLSAPITFNEDAFIDCTLMIELADAAGFPSIFETIFDDGDIFPSGDGVAPYVLYVLDRFECVQRREAIVVSYLRHNIFLRNSDGTEEEKVAAAGASYLRVSPKRNIIVGDFFNCMNKGGGLRGVLRHILQFL